MKKFVRMLACLVLSLSLMPATAYAGTSTKNAKAHIAYAKKLSALKRGGHFTEDGTCAYVDLTGDGIDEMVTRWWPSVYTYRNGKVKRVHNVDFGSTTYSHYYPKKKMFVCHAYDHAGSWTNEYYKWNGKKFVRVASSYTPTKAGRDFGFSAEYWTKKSGYVSKKACKKQVKKLVGSARAKRFPFA